MEKKLSFQRITDGKNKYEVLKEASSLRSEIYLSDGIHQFKAQDYEIETSPLRLVLKQAVGGLFGSDLRLTLNIAHKDGILFSMVLFTLSDKQSWLEVDEDILVIQRRAAFRAEIPKMIPCFVEIARNNTTHVLPVMDISMTGAQLWSESFDLDMDEKYKGQIRLYGENIALPLEFIVRRDSVLLGLSVYGVEFIEPSKELAENIQRLLLKVYRLTQKREDSP